MSNFIYKVMQVPLAISFFLALCFLMMFMFPPIQHKGLAGIALFCAALGLMIGSLQEVLLRASGITEYEGKPVPSLKVGLIFSAIAAVSMVVVLILYGAEINELIERITAKFA